MYFHSLFCLLLLLCCMGYCLPDFQLFVALVETFVTGSVVPLSSTVPISDSDSASTASISFRGLLLFQVGVQIGSP
jgi:hypothetical protein